MSLLCGKNPALDAVNAIRDQIKAQLANKKSALGGLASQVSAITSKISEPFQPAPQSTTEKINNSTGIPF